MNIKKSALVLLVVSVIGTGAGYLFTHNYDTGLCYRDLETNTFDVSCSDFFRQLGQPLYFGMAALAVVFTALFFVPQAWSAWKKFAVWFVPLATLLFIFYRDPGSGNLVSPYAETVYIWVSGLYIVVSLAIVVLNVKKAGK